SSGCSRRPEAHRTVRTKRGEGDCGESEEPPAEIAEGRSAPEAGGRVEPSHGDAGERSRFTMSRRATRARHQTTLSPGGGAVNGTRPLQPTPPIARCPPRNAIPRAA